MGTRNAVTAQQVPSAPAIPAAEREQRWLRLVGEDGSHDERQSDKQPATVRRVVGRFAAGNLIAVSLLLGCSVWASHEVAEREALADARATTDLLATLLIQPNLSDGLLTGDPQALARLDTVVEEQLRDASVVRIKIWDDDERIVYSDESRLLGRRFPAGEEELRIPSDGSTSSQLSDLSAAENVYERAEERLLEVYRPVSTPSGKPLVLETYFRYDEVTSRQQQIWLAFAPISASALLLLLLLQLPLVRRMIREIRAGDVERLRLHARAENAATQERRRIAGGLHDGVVQDLSAAPLIMSRAVDRLERGPAAATEDRVLAADLRTATTAVRESVASLRSLLIEIYPPHLAQAGLPAALTDLAARTRSRGVRTLVDLPDDLDLPPDTAALLFRVAQEALHNVVKHARARTAWLTVSVDEEAVTLVVRDDGAGFDPAAIATATRSGHFGMSVLIDLAEAAGATLELATAPGRGTALRLRVPSRDLS